MRRSGGILLLLVMAALAMVVGCGSQATPGAKEPIAVVESVSKGAAQVKRANAQE